MTIYIAHVGKAEFVNYTRSRWLDKLYPKSIWDRLMDWWRGL